MPLINRSYHINMFEEGYSIMRLVLLVVDKSYIQKLSYQLRKNGFHLNGSCFYV